MRSLTVAPASVRIFSASSRFIVTKVPVSTTFLPVKSLGFISSTHLAGASP